jgi:alanine racemase
MTISLTVDERAWRAHVAGFAAAVDGLVPVIKGNGYGFGRTLLAHEAVALADTVAVGTIDEAHGIEAPAILVLTPVRTMSLFPPRDVVLTVGALEHVAVVERSGWRGRVAVKLESSMHRYGAAPAEHAALVDAARRAHLTVDSFMLHLPLPSATYETSAAVAEIASWLAVLDPALPLSVSHVDPTTFAELRHAHPDREWRLRAGTALWHGDKSFLHLTADVIDTRHVRAGTRAGYRGAVVEVDATLVMIGAGSASGLTVLADGRSPFHHRRRRLALLEPPHMHTSIAVVPAGEPCPDPGEAVDVQRPLTTIVPDHVVWS